MRSSVPTPSIIMQDKPHRGWACMPAVILVLLTLAGSIHLPLPGWELFAPSFLLMGLYYWFLYQPSLAPYWLAFILGLLQDSLLGIMLGTHALIFMLLRLLIQSQQRTLMRRTMLGVWAIFAGLSFTTMLCYILMMAIGGMAMPGLGNAFMQWLLTAALYPICHALMNRLYFAMPDSMRHAQ